MGNHPSTATRASGAHNLSTRDGSSLSALQVPNNDAEGRNFQDNDALSRHHRPLRSTESNAAARLSCSPRSHASVSNNKKAKRVVGEGVQTSTLCCVHKENSSKSRSGQNKHSRKWLFRRKRHKSIQKYTPSTPTTRVLSSPRKSRSTVAPECLQTEEDIHTTYSSQERSYSEDDTTVSKNLERYENSSVSKSNHEGKQDDSNSLEQTDANSHLNESKISSEQTIQRSEETQSEDSKSPQETVLEQTKPNEVLAANKLLLKQTDDSLEKKDIVSKSRSNALLASQTSHSKTSESQSMSAETPSPETRVSPHTIQTKESSPIQRSISTKATGLGKSSTYSSTQDSQQRRSMNSIAADPITKWRRGKSIGHGAYGSVYVGLDDVDGRLIAVKEVHVQLHDKRKVAELVREIDLLSSLHHPNIVRYLGTEHDQNSGTLYIFTEWVSCGSIEDLLKKFGRLAELLVKRFGRQLLEGLAYLHANNVVHRDIKGANVLVDASGVVKLADFGASKRILSRASVGSTGKMNLSLRGTPYFMAPEVILQKACGKPADVWSVGCTLLQMVTGRPPWKNMGLDNVHAVLAHIVESEENPAIPQHVSPSLRKLLLKCFERKPENRPTVEELLQDPFFAEEEAIATELSKSPSLPAQSRTMPATSGFSMGHSSETAPISSSSRTAMTSSVSSSNLKRDQTSSTFKSKTAISPTRGTSVAWEKSDTKAKPLSERQLVDVHGNAYDVYVGGTMSQLTPQPSFATTQSYVATFPSEWSGSGTGVPITALFRPTNSEAHPGPATATRHYSLSTVEGAASPSSGTTPVGSMTPQEATIPSLAANVDLPQSHAQTPIDKRQQHPFIHVPTYKGRGQTVTRQSLQRRGILQHGASAYAIMSGGEPNSTSQAFTSGPFAPSMFQSSTPAPKSSTSSRSPFDASPNLSATAYDVNKNLRSPNSESPSRQGQLLSGNESASRTKTTSPLNLPATHSATAADEPYKTAQLSRNGSQNGTFTSDGTVRELSWTKSDLEFEPQYGDRSISQQILAHVKAKRRGK